MNRRQFIGGTAAAVGASAWVRSEGATRTAAAGAHPSVPADGRRPNIVLILADDLGYGDLSCLGAKAWRTPNLDRLAAEGRLMQDAHSPSAVCTPSRYGLLTGQYCWRTPLRTWVLRPNQQLWIAPERLTLPAMLRQVGYRTGVFGKWHLGLGDQDPVDWNLPLRPGPLEVGFDEFFGTAANHTHPPYVFIDGHNIVDRLPGENVVLAPQPGTTGRAIVETQGIAAKRDPGLTHAACAERALAFMRKSLAQGVPFFAYWPTPIPHERILPHPDFVGRSGAGAYGDFMAELDASVGRMLEMLRELHVDENTLIIFTSDNGGDPRFAQADGPKAMSAHQTSGPWRGSKRGLYEGGHRVPFIARWPGVIDAGSTSNALIGLTDMMATLAALIGQHLPENAAEDSLNVLTALVGPPAATLTPRIQIYHSVAGAFAVREGDWKLILAPDAGDWGWLEHTKPGPEGWQLFNLRNDPGESVNLVAEEPAVAARLSERLDEIRRAGRSRR